MLVPWVQEPCPSCCILFIVSLVAGRVWGTQQSFIKDPLTEWRWVRLVASLVQFLGWEDPLEKEMAVFLLGESPWTEEPGRLQSMRSLSVGHD